MKPNAMRWVRAFVIRLGGLFNRSRRERELADEMESHLALRVEDNVRAGMSPEEARRQAVLEIGSIEAAKESYRDRASLPFLENLAQDIRYAVRVLRKDAGFTTVAVLTLAFGIGANTAIFSLINAVILEYLPVRNPTELVQVTMVGNGTVFTNPIWEEVRDRQDVFSGVFAFGTTRFDLSSGGESRYANSNWVSGDFFTTLGVQPALGRLFTPADDKRGCAGTAVLSYDFWQREHAGSAAVLNQKISLDGHPFQILGVARSGFNGVQVGRATDIFVPLCSEAITRGELSSLSHRSHWWLEVIARPKPGLGPQQVKAQLNVVAPALFPVVVPERWRAEDQERFRKERFDTRPAAKGLSHLRSTYQAALTTLMIVVAVVLLIACANVANLLLARAAARQREMAIRLALGSGRWRLMRQLLTESFLLSLAGAALGALFAQWSSRALIRLLSSRRDQVSLDVAMDGRVLVFTIAVAVATGILFGLAPAWRSTRVDPHGAMRAGSRATNQEPSRFGLGKALVMTQVALSLTLLVGAGLLLGSFRALATLDPGFQAAQVLLVRTDLRNANYPPERRAAARREILDALRTIPGVRSASSSDITPIEGAMWNADIEVKGFQPKSRRDAIAYFNEVSDRYFETMGTPLLAGRDFDQRDTTSSPKVAIINETMTRKFFSDANPLGKTFRASGPSGFEDPPLEIIGVVKDTKYATLREENRAIAYLPVSQSPQPGLFVHFELAAAGSATDLVPAVKSVMEQVNRDVMLQFIPLSLQVQESLTRERLLAFLSSLFGGLALMLAAIGLYGVTSYNVTRRRNEIGIRMALGAEQSRVRRMVLGDVGILIAVGLAIGAAISFGASRLVSTFLYGLKPNDPFTLLTAAVLLAAVAVIAGYIPARRASRLDPMAALREE